MPPTTSQERLRQRRNQQQGFQSLLQTPEADALLAQVQQNIGQLDTPLAQLSRFGSGQPGPEKLFELEQGKLEADRTREQEIAVQQAKDFAQAAGVGQSALGVSAPGRPLPGAAIAREFLTGEETGARAQLVRQSPLGKLALAESQAEIGRRSAAEQRAVAAENRAQVAFETEQDKLADPFSTVNINRALEQRRALGELEGVAVPARGQAQVTNPLTGQPQIINLPGTEPFQVAQEQLLASMRGLDLVNEIVADVEDAGITGTEFFGQRSVRMSGKRARLMSEIFSSRGLGAPQGPDVELVERGLPDPGSFWTNVAALGAAPIPGVGNAMKQQFVVGYENIAQEMQDRMEDILLQNPALLDQVDVNSLDPASDLAQSIRKLQRGQ